MHSKDRCATTAWPRCPAALALGLSKFGLYHPESSGSGCRGNGLSVPRGRPEVHPCTSFLVREGEVEAFALTSGRHRVDRVEVFRVNGLTRQAIF